MLEHYLPIEVKNNKYQLMLANSKVAAKSLIKIQTKFVHMRIAKHFKIIQFNIAKIKKHNIILGLL